MKKFLIISTLTLGACSSFQKDPEPPVEILPIRNCVQQKEPKDPAIPCKVGNWWSPGDPKCSSTEEICKKKRFD